MLQLLIRNLIGLLLVVAMVTSLVLTAYIFVSDESTLTIKILSVVGLIIVLTVGISLLQYYHL